MAHGGDVVSCFFSFFSSSSRGRFTLQHAPAACLAYYSGHGSREVIRGRLSQGEIGEGHDIPVVAATQQAC